MGSLDGFEQRDDKVGHLFWSQRGSVTDQVPGLCQIVNCLGVVTHTYNLSLLGGRGRRIMVRQKHKTLSENQIKKQKDRECDSSCRGLA
jgi:hypothetical protein